jgi:hypothetical protein
MRSIITLTISALFVLPMAAQAGHGGGGGSKPPTNSNQAVKSQNIGSQSSGAGAGKVTFNPFSISRKTSKPVTASNPAHVKAAKDADKDKPAPKPDPKLFIDIDGVKGESADPPPK